MKKLLLLTALLLSTTADFAQNTVYINNKRKNRLKNLNIFYNKGIIKYIFHDFLRYQLILIGYH